MIIYRRFATDNGELRISLGITAPSHVDILRELKSFGPVDTSRLWNIGQFVNKTYPSDPRMSNRSPARSSKRCLACKAL